LIQAYSTLGFHLSVILTVNSGWFFAALARVVSLFAACRDLDNPLTDQTPAIHYRNPSTLPHTPSDWPDTCRAFGEQRNNTICATSSAETYCPIDTRLRICS
jgi:hypothetical protein